MTIATVIFVVTAATAMLVGVGGNANELSWYPKEVFGCFVRKLGDIAWLYVTEIQLCNKAFCVLLPELCDWH
jgi:hypothetical protein